MLQKDYSIEILMFYSQFCQMIEIESHEVVVLTKLKMANASQYSSKFSIVTLILF
jgi:hypothetical protein